MKHSEADFIDRLQIFTEKLLTHRARRIEKKKRKQRARGVVMEWLDAFLWAVMVVLLLNQYLLQAYQIPSGSMRDTLIGGLDPYTGRVSSSDRIFVDKLTFGPEILPGAGKLPGFRTPYRSEVIIFENPEYTSPSLAYEIAQRVLYMVTLSLVDLDRFKGDTAHHFLIKRQVAEDGDRVKFKRGELYLQPQGESSLLPEAEFKELANLEYGNHLLVDDAYYEKLHANTEAVILDRAGLDVSSELAEKAAANWVSPLKKSIRDIYEEQQVASKILHRLYPQNETVAYEAARYERGIYVPENWVLPLGDNRSDSGDGRYFGPIPSNAVLGRALFLYWPLSRLGGIR